MTRKTTHYSICKAAIPTPTLITVTPDNYHFYNPLCHHKLTTPSIRLTTDPTKVTCKKCLWNLK